MTNIAFTTLVILILASPGYIVRSRFYAGEFTRQVLPRNWTDDIGKAILYSIPFHLLAIGILASYQQIGLSHATLTFEDAARLLTGQYGKDGDKFSSLVLHFYDNKFYVLGYFFSVAGLALVAGHVLRHIVWTKELDVSNSWLFRYRNDWLYLLLGRGKLAGISQQQTLVWADVLTDQLTEVEGKTRIYRGIVAGFSTNEDGSLREIILTRTRRGKFKKDAKGEWQFSLELIKPGDYFVIPYGHIQNLNVIYLSS
jgi:hypothetical protein